METRISVNLADVLSICSQKKKTVVVEAIYEGIPGTIWVEQGDVVHAKVQDMEGKKAFFSCMKWPECSIVELPYTTPPSRSMKDPIHSLLLEAAHMEDEFNRTSHVLDTDKAVEVGKNVWWVGHRKKGAPLQINVYLKKFDGSAVNKPPVWMLIDPGSQLHFPDISRRISELVDLSSIQLFSVNHQDPDVCSNTVFLVEMNPKAICLTTETTSRLLAHYGIKRFRFVEDANWRLKLVTGHTLRFFHTPFCHFAGAFGIYDPESGMVFTGDLFGGTSIHADGAPLWARPEDWDDVVTFHTIYMPSNETIKVAIREMKKAVGGVPEFIAPQHGGIIKGEMVKEWVDKLSNLKVGIDLLPKSDNGPYADYLAAANEIIKEMPKIDVTFSLKNMMSESKSLAEHFKVSGDQNGFSAILQKPEDALAELRRALMLGKAKGAVGAIKALVVRAMRVRRLPVPSDGGAQVDDIFTDAEDVLEEG